MNRRHLVTLKDIARELGISVATVSRALRDTYDVSEETKNSVLTKVKELNYRPNFNAMGLVNHKSHNIAVILPTITNYYFSTVITGIQYTAYKNAYNIILHVTGESPEREITIAKELPLSSIDGVLVSVTSESNKCDHLQEIIDNGVPVVFFDRVAESIKTSKVMQNDYEGAFTAVEHLIKRGYRKIAHISGPFSLAFTKERLRGYLTALKKHKIPFNQNWVIHSEFNQESGGADTYKLLSMRDRPDAIFAVNDRKAVGAILTLKKKGIRIGQEIGVIGFTNDPVSAIISPSLTTVEEPASAIGEKSCELLLKHISKKDFIPEEVILKGKLIARESTSRTS
ncbi:MAG: LacI family transcriptional regulator [Chitinophagaceae bacterium]|nr:MAG: LacI family transcriptional regulator [Chitinophagaceae bacterium]